MDGSSVLDDDGDRCQEAIKSAGVTWASNCALTSNQWLTALRSCISIDGPAQQSLNAHPQPGNFDAAVSLSESSGLKLSQISKLRLTEQ